MKTLMMLTLLGAGGLAAAQTTPTERALLMADARTDAARMQADASKAEAKQQSEGAKLEADEAKMHAQLDAARKRLDEAARQVAELSDQLALTERPDFVFTTAAGPRRALLGVQIDPASGKQGARVLSVSPGGAAEEAGLINGDVIVALDGKPIAGSADPNRSVVEHMREVKPDQKVNVRVLRAGKNKDFLVVARPMMSDQRMFNLQMPDIGPAMSAMPEIYQFRTFWRDDFGGMELAKITPKLGAYFGAADGVLVVQSPENSAFKLEDGDVIQAIDGRKPDDGAHALRILRSYKSGEKLNLSVLRQRKPMTLAVSMPERAEFEDRMMQQPPMPPMAPMPGMPAAPAVPPPPGGAGPGTDD